MRQLRLLLVEDHPLMAEAIRLAISRDRAFEVVGAVESVSDVAAAAVRLGADIVLLDIGVRGKTTVDVLRALRRISADSKLVVLSAAESDEAIDVALRAGAHAFITKRIDPLDLAGALRQVVDQTLFQSPRANPLLSHEAAGAAALTDRELVVLAGAARGLSNKAIAEQLSYSEQTVKLELARIYRKLGVSSRTEAAAAAFRDGLVEPGEADTPPRRPPAVART
jgi:DNA-binding NarL/FixJ family response regulator